MGQGEMDRFTWEGQNDVAVSELGCENPWVRAEWVISCFKNKWTIRKSSLTL